MSTGPRLCIVTGGRDWGGNVVVEGRRHQARNIAFAALDRWRPDIVIHGACRSYKPGDVARGADGHAEAWCAHRGAQAVAVPVYSARIDRFGRGALVARNRLMATMLLGFVRAMPKFDEAACIRFPGGSGTAAMVQIAEHGGIPVVDGLALWRAATGPQPTAEQRAVAEGVAALLRERAGWWVEPEYEP